ncbi:MAG TPA: response regulator transcription factor [Mycobacteriales bacterium]|nr:response regulator transcription factor [Mycobacteriales bacterium]
MSTADVVDPEVATGVTILVVDDAPDMRMVARAFLERAGLVVVGEAGDGDEALQMWRDLDPPPIPSVIILDNQMPGSSGLEVAEQILSEMPDQVIVLFSAYLNADLVAQAKRLGVAGCVPKKDVRQLPGIIKDIVAARG